MNIDKKIISSMLISVSDLFIEHNSKLSEIDSKFGDGDHGVTINKIALLIKREVSEWQSSLSIHDFIENVGQKIMGIGGGSAGPLYGTLIGGFALPLSDESEIDAFLLKKMFKSCLDEMFDITTARVGDKTMMDALIPAVEASQNAKDDIYDILSNASKAAIDGCEKSQQFISKFGRAKSYKEKTIGTPDAGAVSTSLLFRGLSDGFKM